MVGPASAVEITGTQRLTSSTADQYNPVISGNVVVYTDTRAGNADIYLYNLQSATEINITNDPANQLLNDVSGDFVVYSDYRTGVPQIWAYHIPSALACRVSFTSHPSLSPAIGGELLVFQDQNQSDTDIASFDLSTLNPDDFAQSCAELESGALAGPTVLDLGPGRQLSPKTSGDWVVYQGTNDTNQPRIFAYNRETLLTVAMPEHGKSQLLPDIDGARVAYVEDDGTNRDIAFFDLESGTFVQVTADAYRQNYPSISGNFIAFEDSRAGNLDIHIYDLSTGQQTPLTTDPANQYLNSIEGGRVVYTDASAGNLDVVLVTFNVATPEVPGPCQREGTVTPIADMSGRTDFALDDESLIEKRESIHWPFLHRSRVGGDFDYVDDHHRITYGLSLPNDAPQALITIHAQVKKSTLPAVLTAAGFESRAGLVLKANGAERRWDESNDADLTLVAERTYDPAAAFDASTTLDAPRALRVPPNIAVTAGNGGNGWATVRFDGLTCRYRAGSRHEHPTSAHQRARGRLYWFSSCDDADLNEHDDDDEDDGEHDDDDDYHGEHDDDDDHDHRRRHGTRVGDTVLATTISLSINSGDSHAGPTELTLAVYAVSSAGDDAWRDISFTAPVPLFAGHNTLSLEGPEYGKSYWKYRRVSFAAGGMLRAFARPACVPDLSLLPECHRPDAEVLYGPETFVRHGGPIETFPYHYETSAAGPAIVCITNGDGDGSLRASSALVWHNGEPALGPNAFGPAVAETAAPIQALLANEGNVELRSTPGSFVTMKIVRAVAPPASPSDPTPPPRKYPRLHLGDCSQTGEGLPAWMLVVGLLLVLRRVRYVP
jgi:beta propeller repeat protein